MDAVVAAVNQHKPNDTIEVTLLRNATPRS